MAMIAKITVVVSAVLVKAFHSPRQVSSRYTRTPSKTVYTLATEADSEGVRKPS